MKPSAEGGPQASPDREGGEVVAAPTLADRIATAEATARAKREALEAATAALARATGAQFMAESKLADVESGHARAVAEALIAGSAIPSAPAGVAAARANDSAASSALIHIAEMHRIAADEASNAELQAAMLRAEAAAIVRRDAALAACRDILRARAALAQWMAPGEAAEYVARLTVPQNAPDTAEALWRPIQIRIRDAGTYGRHVEDHHWHALAPLPAPESITALARV